MIVDSCIGLERSLTSIAMLHRRAGVRLVTHNDVSFKDCQVALDAIKDVLESMRDSTTNTNGSGTDETFAPTGYQ